MQSTQDINAALSAINAHELALRAQLRAAENTLTALFHARERLIKTINGGAWDVAQYRLDDMQQNLGDIIESLAEIEPFNSAIHK
jgi:hypothetical protein